MPVEKPPVYDTTAMIQPLMKLADYMSPEKRAMRKAAVAKANYEYRLYVSGKNPAASKDPFYFYKWQKYNDDHNLSRARLQKSLADGTYQSPAQKADGGWKPSSMEPPLPAPDMDSGNEEEDEDDTSGLEDLESPLG